MIKIILIVLAVIVLAFLIYLFILGNTSKSGSAPGLSAGVLSRCADKPNCINSEFSDDASHYISPIGYPESMSQDAMKQLSEVILELGGEITGETDSYLSATFTSAIFGFVDDLECRNDASDFKIHIRSASRVGHGDFGANKKRVELISRLFSERIQ